MTHFPNFGDNKDFSSKSKTVTSKFSICLSSGTSTEKPNGFREKLKGNDFRYKIAPFTPIWVEYNFLLKCKTYT